MNARVTVISVAYNSQDVLAEMVASVPESAPVIVVDNGSTTPQAAGRAQVLRLERNEGFGRGCNAGAALARTEFLLFLNPDARLSPGALDALVASAEAVPEVAGWNPCIIDGAGRQIFLRRSKIKPSETMTSLPLPEKDCKIGTLSGAAIFVRKERFDALGGFDPAIFLYHEDEDLSLRLAETGPLMRCFGATVTHISGHGSPRDPVTARLKAYHMARSRVYAYAKHGHRGAGGKTLVKGLFGLLSPVNLVSARKRAKAMGFVQGALSALRDGGVYRG